MMLPGRDRCHGEKIMDRGSVYRRCGCRDKATGRLLGARCPGLRSREHGSWYFSADLPSATGERHRMRRGVSAIQDAASAALEALASPAAGPERGLSTGEWLSRWLASRVSLRASTSRSYAEHVRSCLLPYLGAIPLAALTAGDLQAIFTAVIRDEGALGRPVSAATLHRIHATLRPVLNGAVRAGLIRVNPGRHPELPRAARLPAAGLDAGADRALAARGLAAGRWRVDRRSDRAVPGPGARSPLYALFHLVALRGLRRGEAAGLRWSDRDLDAGTLTVSGQLQQPGGRLVVGPPKSDAGRRVIALDRTTLTALRKHRIRQQAERAAAGTGGPRPGTCTTVTGTPFRRDRMTRLFAKLVAASGLPPVTLHGLRHGATTLALAAEPTSRSCRTSSATPPSS
jgi:integrase